ncbi:tRNA (adenine(22)-N(1))-methyltransferase TrmK [Mycoplasmoides genitalium]
MKKRISTIANLVQSFNPKLVYDIGCDHSYLTSYLIKTNQNLTIVNSDISKNALLSNYQKFKNNNNIHFFVSDGFNSLPELNINSKIGVIAGLGGLKIINIISQKENFINRFVIQPQSNLIELRSFLSLNSWDIVNETLVQDREFIYPILVIEKLKKPFKLTKELVILGPKLINFKDKHCLMKHYQCLLRVYQPKQKPSLMDLKIIETLNKIITSYESS